MGKYDIKWFESEYTGMKIAEVELREAICYSRLYPSREHLSPGQCIVVHQHINGHQKLSRNTWFAIEHILKKIKETKWEKPKFEYHWESRELLTYKY